MQEEMGEASAEILRLGKQIKRKYWLHQDLSLLFFLV
jgi:hypothetical protein